ncbi:MAG TPA: Asp-tRNA(Asn)/Glu-tRNA(Gln) amidotransferase subunit GatB [Flavisolibacter sp.]|nr:Asp-tRNA(Asn)/Glu-tRNA(Gln) amidotransferase subunit GatB [Flavisolibacter sp.]
MSDKVQYEIVVGLEVHAQLLTKTKLFCGDTTEFGKAPNSQISVISLGYPGTLPRLNKEAISLAVRLGLACNCQIVQHNYFARKNYFYADLPKGYQISQHTTPICKNGFLEITVGKETKKINLNRIHIEEDAGKSLHDEDSDFSNLDFNRAGMPLLEIVTEPDLRSAEEAFAYVTSLRKLVRHLNVCDGNMEQGSLRCDVNISVRKKGEQKLGTKVEIKNLNSIRFIKKAIEFETGRLISLLEEGKTIVQETRGFDETDFTTYSIRVKEDEDDYRYFPEPDLPPFFISNEMIEKIRSEMPALQTEIKEKLIAEYGLSTYDAEQLSEDSELSNFFFELVKHSNNYKASANWILGPIKNHLSANEIALDETDLQPKVIAETIELIDKGKISYGIAVQQIFPAILKNPALNLSQFIEENQLQIQTSQTEIESLIEAALNKHSEKIPEYKKGKKGLISLFVGEVMKLSKGKADAKLVTEKIIEKLKA